jgi:hypothetical protein
MSRSPRFGKVFKSSRDDVVTRSCTGCTIRTCPYEQYPGSPAHDSPARAAPTGPPLDMDEMERDGLRATGRVGAVWQPATT